MSTLERMHKDCDRGNCPACEWERQEDVKAGLIHDTAQITDAQIMAHPKVKALIDALEFCASALVGPSDQYESCDAAIQDARAALAAIKDDGSEE